MDMDMWAETIIVVVLILAVAYVTGRRRGEDEEAVCSCGSTFATSNRFRMDEWQKRHRDCVAHDAAVKAAKGLRGV